MAPLADRLNMMRTCAAMRFPADVEICSLGFPRRALTGDPLMAPIGALRKALIGGPSWALTGALTGHPMGALTRALAQDLRRARLRAPITLSFQVSVLLQEH